MASIGFNYHSYRAHKARLGVALGSSRKLLSLLFWVMLASGIVALVLGERFGWLLLGLATLPYMLKEWYDGELKHAPNGKGTSADNHISADI